VLRGEVYLYEPAIALPPRRGRSNLRLIVSSDELNTRPGQRLVRGVQVLTEDPGELLAVPTAHGFAAVMTSEVIIARRLVQLVGAVTADELAAVDVAIRAMYGV
jgi:beta-glucosidase-like glycosyl hydrolase